MHVLVCDLGFLLTYESAVVWAQLLYLRSLKRCLFLNRRAKCILKMTSGSVEIKIFKKDSIQITFALLSAVYGWSPREPSGCCCGQSDSYWCRPAPLSELECHLQDHQRRPKWALHYTHWSCHQWRHGHCGEGNIPSFHNILRFSVSRRSL